MWITLWIMWIMWINLNDIVDNVDNSVEINNISHWNVNKNVNKKRSAF
jgi:hypothetical protein